MKKKIQPEVASIKLQASSSKQRLTMDPGDDRMGLESEK